MIYKISELWGGHTLSLETGKMARQADGSVVVRYGDSVVLCTVVAEKKDKPELDFVPLSVHYQEKSFAAGRIPGGFVKREGKPSERETLISRLIDRPIRPLFPSSLRREIQVICTVLSYDPHTDIEVASIIGASAALAVSGIPFEGPVAACRVGYDGQNYTLNPQESSLLDLIVAGTKDGILMVESEAHELSEDIMCGALTFGHQAFQSVLNMIKKLQKKVAKPSWHLNEINDKSIESLVKKKTKKALENAYSIPSKQERRTAIQAVLEDLFALEHEHRGALLAHFHAMQADVVRTRILKENKRIDGRSLNEVRPIICEIGVLPRTHGSALFTRGETQALAVTTLGTGNDEQVVDDISGEYREKFMLHYNFPPFSVGEVGRLSAPGRREIGHGKLAWRALKPIIQASCKDFPYTIRTVSEILESNGSSSMASVCGTSLSLMDAGVPLERPVAGIAMGLIKEGKKYAVLSDISGDEDHLGDMDFKVAGTDQGITALQMDLKITGISIKVMEEALTQAKEGRLHILECMNKTLKRPKETLSIYAPRIMKMRIDKEKIRDLIGPGGKTIRELCEQTKTKIDIGEDGALTIAGTHADLIDRAIEIISQIGVQPEVGMVYKGVVTRLMDFGALVQFLGGKDGMVHISELAHHRVEKVEDIVKVGQEVQVKVVSMDDRGKIRLSIKQVS